MKNQYNKSQNPKLFRKHIFDILETHCSDKKMTALSVIPAVLEKMRRYEEFVKDTFPPKYFQLIYAAFFKYFYSLWNELNVQDIFIIV